MKNILKISLSSFAVIVAFTFFAQALTVTLDSVNVQPEQSEPGTL
jgi:hypothetical protein